jgi:hypothetical protein
MTEFMRGHISFSGLLTNQVRLLWLIACVHFRPSLLRCLWGRLCVSIERSWPDIGYKISGMTYVLSCDGNLIHIYVGI